MDKTSIQIYKKDLPDINVERAKRGLSQPKLITLAVELLKAQTAETPPKDN